MAEHPGDVLVDCGRLAAGSPAMAITARADAALLVVRPDMEGVAHLRSRVEQLQRTLRPDEPDGTPILVAVATSYRDTQTATQLQQLLDAERLVAEVVGVVAHDDKAARVLASTRTGSLARSLLARSARGLVPRIDAAVGRTGTGRA